MIRYVVFILSLLVVGCSSYKPSPLDTSAIHGGITQDRQKITEDSDLQLDGKLLTFDAAAQYISLHNPDLKALKQTYKTFEAVSNISTPWPNPGIEGGVVKGEKLEDAVASATQPFVGIAFTIPLWGKLGLQDELNKLQAQRSLLDFIVKHRVMYLDLRCSYLSYGIHLDVEQEQKALNALVDNQRESALRLSKAGDVDVLEAGELEQALIEQSLASLDIEKEKNTALSSLALLLAKSPDALKKITVSNLDPLPTSLPNKKAIIELMLAHRPALALLKADYLIAEKTLQLEIRKQYPDIEFGGSYEKEPGEKKTLYGLSLGIDLPVFDRNQQEIARAFQSREKIRVQYQAEVHRALTLVDQHLQNYLICQKKFQLLKNKLIPSSESTVSMARRLLIAGDIDRGKYLDLLSQGFSAKKRKLNLALSMVESLIDLEMEIGHPLYFLSKTDKTLFPILNTPSLKGVKGKSNEQ